MVQQKYNQVNEDLQRERNKGTFDPEELTNLIDGGVDKTRERRELVDFFIRDPIFKDKIPTEYLSYVDKYEDAVRKSCLMIKKISEWTEKKKTGETVDLYQALLGGLLGTAALKDGMPFAVHYVMFLPTLMGQATLEQQAYWIGRAWNCEIMGTYAQTELGHGTFVRGLETTATYDPRSEEFVLHSPTLTSYKWWPGGLGHTANYAVVLAQLHTRGVCHGIHPFIVQLRDEETHMPMRGVKIGEIGCKLGMNGTNNGYLGFDHVRIPRENMLMKNSKVLKDGTYVKSPSDKLTYGTMIFVRVAIIKGIAASYLAKAVTIATRYSAVRRQSEIVPGEQESQIIDYKTQQYKLFPHIASSLAMFFASRWLWNMYNTVTTELDQGDLERLPELHAISCCLKAVASYDAAQGIEECRKATGGHGYMTCSSFPLIYGLATAAETYEGEHTVMLLQTARYLMKAWHQAKAGITLTPITSYMVDAKSSKISPWKNDISCLINSFKQVAYGLIKDTTDRVDRLVSTGKRQEHVWNECSNFLVQCAEAHCRLFLVEQFYNEVKAIKVSPALRKVLLQLCELYAVYNLLKKLGHFLMYSNLRIGDVAGLQEWQDRLLDDIRPNAVSLVDSFDICDEILNSALGAYDGNVYERLFEEANRSPLNAVPVNKSFHQYLKPFLKGRKVSSVIMWLKIRINIFLLLILQIYSALITGPSMYVVKKLERCEFDIDYQIFTDNYNVNKVSKTKYTYSGNVTVNSTIGGHNVLDITCANWSNNGWRDNYFQLHIRKPCAFFRTVAPEFMGKAFKQAGAEGCPIKPKVYRIKDQSVVLKNISIPIPQGKYKIKSILTEKDNIVGCLILVIEIMPKD